MSVAIRKHRASRCLPGKRIQKTFDPKQQGRRGTATVAFYNFVNPQTQQCQVSFSTLCVQHFYVNNYYFRSRAEQLSTVLRAGSRRTYDGNRGRSLRCTATEQTYPLNTPLHKQRMLHRRRPCKALTGTFHFHTVGSLFEVSAHRVLTQFMFSCPS